VAAKDYAGLLYVAGGAAVVYLLFRGLKSSVAAVAENTVGESGTTSGGILPSVGAILAGSPQYSQTVKETTLAAGSGSVAPASGQSSSDPLAYITGDVVDPKEGGTVKRALFSETVRLVVELTNAASTLWTGDLRLEVQEDYFLKDAQGSFSRVVTVAPRSTLRLDVDYQLRGGTHLREPNLFVNLFAGVKFLGQSKVVVTT
jgi:hypothetical protein